MRKTSLVKAGAGEVVQPRNPYAGQIADLFRPIERHLHRVDPMAALDEWGRCPPHLRQAIENCVEEWLIRALALSPTDQCPWIDRQGLSRLIYLAWPEIPLRPFGMSILPDLMARFQEYDERYRPVTRAREGETG